MMHRSITVQTTLQLLQSLKNTQHLVEYIHEKHKILVSNTHAEELLQLRLPILLSTPNQDLEVIRNPVHYIILLIQAGNCALGYFENGQCLDHKVIRAYMVRKKQGLSQIKYLKTKGKSRAGSRVRLGESDEFFDDINERLQRYFKDHVIHRIAISCSKTLLPFLFRANVPTPFDKRDIRLFKIPKHVHTPIYEVLLDVNKYLTKGEIFYKEPLEPYVNLLLSSKREDQQPEN